MRIALQNLGTFSTARSMVIYDWVREGSIKTFHHVVYLGVASNPKDSFYCIMYARMTTACNTNLLDRQKNVGKWTEEFCFLKIIQRSPRQNYRIPWEIAETRRRIWLRRYFPGYITEHGTLTARDGVPCSWNFDDGVGIIRTGFCPVEVLGGLVPSCPVVSRQYALTFPWHSAWYSIFVFQSFV